MTPEQFYIWAPTVAAVVIGIGGVALIFLQRQLRPSAELRQEAVVIFLSLALAITLCVMASSVDTTPKNTEPVKIGQCIHNE